MLTAAVVAVLLQALMLLAVVGGELYRKAETALQRKPLVERPGSLQGLVPDMGAAHQTPALVHQSYLAVQPMEAALDVTGGTRGRATLVEDQCMAGAAAERGMPILRLGALQSLAVAVL